MEMEGDLHREMKDGINNFCVFRFDSDNSLLLLFREGLRIIEAISKIFFFFFCNQKAKLNPDVMWDGGLALSLNCFTYLITSLIMDS
jgi:hypothetical protein